MFNRVNSEEFVGRTGIYKLIGDYVFASYLIRLRTNSKLEPDVLNLFLNSKYGKLSIRKLSRRAVNQANVNAQELQSILIPNFSKNFQEKISKICNESWNLIVNARKKMINAEQSLLEITMYSKPKQILSFDGNFATILEKERMDAEHFQPQYEKLRKQINNFSKGSSKLTNIANLSKTRVEPGEKPDQFFNYIELANINNIIGTIEESQSIRGQDAPSRARMLLKKGQVIFSSVEGSLDKVALIPKEFDNAIASTGFFVLNPKNVNQGYFLALIKSPIVREQLRCEASGTILTAVPQTSLKKILVPNIEKSKRDKINQLVMDSNSSWNKAKILFQEAKNAIEISIEKNEKIAINSINKISL